MSAEATARTTPRRAATRQRLLDAAAQVFAETGLAAASVEEICERAGYTRGAFYSNFDTKDQLFLELSARTSTVQIDAVRARVATRAVGDADGDATALMQEVLEVASGDRAAVQLLAEIRVHAMRTPALATPYLAQEDELSASVSQLVADIARAQRIRLRATPAVAARILLTTWTAASERAVMAGADADEMRLSLEQALAETAEALMVAE